MSSSFRYALGTIFVPRRSFRRLMDDAHPFGRGFRTVSGTGILWALTSLALAVTGAVPMAPIFVSVGVANYYVWQAIFVLPGLLVLWFAASVVVHILGGGRRRGGSLKRTLGVFGFAQVLPLRLVWLVETAIAIFYGLGMGQQEMVDLLSVPSTVQTVFLAVFGAAAAWSFLLAWLAAAVSQKIHWAWAFFLGLLAEILFVGPIVLLMR